MNRHHVTLMIVAFFPLLVLGGCKKDQKAVAGHAGNSPSFRVIGYLPNTADIAVQAGTLDFAKLTHLNIAFINPDSTGVFAPEASLLTVTAMAHAHGVSVLMSLGGGNPPGWLKLWIHGALRARLVASLVAYAVQYGFDGVDVDLEGDFINDDYESFVTGLAAALAAKNKLITAAIATAYAASYTDKALSVFDFVNIMSYDRTGPWNPANPGQHAPLAMATDDLSYWGKTRGITKARLNLGLPFYGYGFGTNAPESIPYKDLVRQYPDAWNLNQVTVTGGGIIYYNGAATIKTKTSIALQNTGGVMIWQLLQDATGPQSLLRAIDSVIHL